MRPPTIWNVGEHVCGGEPFLQALRRLVFVGGECSDVDQPSDAIIGSRGCNDGSPVRVADQYGRAADPPQPAPDGGDIALERVQAVLDRYHLVPLRLKRGDHLSKGRAVGP